MARAVVSYDKDLPEVADRQAHLKPDAHLRKKEGRPDEFEVVEGRRPSNLLLINRLRKAVDDWRDAGYPGASPVGARLFTYWFDDDHLVGGKAFRYYFGQREAVDAILGRKPAKDLTSHGLSMVERLKGLDHLLVINDEAHHVHDEKLEWHRCLMGLHGVLPTGLSLWLDFSATPKDQNGTYFPWVICDYPLAQAVEDRIVKAPIIVHQVKRSDPERVTADNVIEAYGDWLTAALSRWREHVSTYKKLALRPVLFIMAEQNRLADEIGRWLVETKTNRLRKSEVLIIHTPPLSAVEESYTVEVTAAASEASGCAAGGHHGGAGLALVLILLSAVAIATRLNSRRSLC